MPAHEPLAQLAGFENFFDAHGRSRARPTPARCSAGSTGTATELEVPLARGAARPTVRIAIRAGDILLATEEPRGLSARNVLRGRLVVARRARARRWSPHVDAGARFVVHLTPGAPNRSS